MDYKNLEILASLRDAISQIKIRLTDMEVALEQLEASCAEAQEEVPQEEVPQQVALEEVVPNVEDAAEVTAEELVASVEDEATPLVEDTEPVAEEPATELIPAAEDTTDEAQAAVPEADAAPASEDVVSQSVEDDTVASEEADRRPAVIDVMADRCAWKTDIPGSPVRNILSAISLNDRLLFINTLFDEDGVKFQKTISLFNSLSSLAEAETYVRSHFPQWDMGSDTVYRFMMAVRRKLI